MRSKHRYALSRLLEIDIGRMPEIAAVLLRETTDFELAELVAKHGESEQPYVSPLTRRRLAALFKGEPLCHEFEEIAFLEQLWPISSTPSKLDGTWSNRTLRDDIVQHTVANDDWCNRELLEHLGIMECSNAQLFRLLEALVHPTAVPDEIQTARVGKINDLLRHDRYSLQRSGTMSGSACYQVQAIAIGSPADDTISSTLERFEPDQVHTRWAAALERRGSDPAGAITLARTLVEDVLRWLLDDLGVEVSDGDELPQLYRKVTKALKLAPDDHTEQVFKQILVSCQSVVEALAAIRNKLGDAHSPGPKRARPAARHAELAVNLAGSMATFLVSTWEARKEAPPAIEVKTAA